MFDPAQLCALAQQLLDKSPNPAVRVRLLRDVLGCGPEHPDLRAARLELAGLAWVRQLTASQLPDGSWGRFHSQDTKIETVFPTTEAAIRRALALGLDQHDPLLARAVDYMQAVLAGQAVWTDRVEQAEGWPICVEAITAGTLAQVNLGHPAIRPAWEYWVKISEGSFPNGEYDSESEWRAHTSRRGRGTRYLGSRYVLTLLGACAADLPQAIERRLVRWKWKDPQGIGYLGADLQQPEPRYILSWLESLELLSAFPTSREILVPAVEWLWSQRNPDGLWDFGSRAGKSCYFPLSEDWRKPGNRAIDHTTRVLALLRKLI